MLVEAASLCLVDQDLTLRLDITCHHNPVEGWPAFYQFSMQQNDQIAGVIHLRIGDQAELTGHLGHIGYEVFPDFRGQRFALRATQLLLPLARQNGLQELWITCNPDNVPSLKTCMHLGADYIDQVPVPEDCPMYERGERVKCRFRLRL